MNRLVIPVFYAFPIWLLFLVVGILALTTTPNALSIKHGGLTFACFFFWMFSLVPIGLFSVERPNKSITKAAPARVKRLALLSGTVGAVLLVLMYLTLLILPYPSASAIIALAILPSVLIAGPFYVRSKIVRSSP